MKNLILTSVILLVLGSICISCSNIEKPAETSSNSSSSIQQEDPNILLKKKQLKFVNSRYQAFLCYDLTTFKNASSQKHHGRAMGTESPEIWNPTGLDVEQWAQTLIDGKMAGGVLTTKHTAGFCLWDSKYTDYDVASSPVKTDIVGEFVKVFREKGLQVGLYFCTLDYHHGLMNGVVNEDMIEFMKNQLTELLSNYGPIDYILLDAWSTWPTNPNFDDIHFKEMYDLIHSLQPECLIVSHTYESNLAHAELPFEDAAGRWYPYNEDYMRPAAGSDVIQKSWFWDDNNFPVTRSVDYILGRLKSYNDHNGVYILNTPINTSGFISEDVVERLKEVAAVWEKPEDLKEAGADWGYSYDVRTNLAFQKPCYQSSTDNFIRDKRGFPRAEIAVDGVTEGDWMLEQTSGTKKSDTNWWKVDLEEEHPIKEIEIFNATDDASKLMLQNFTVTIYDELYKEVWSQTVSEYPNPNVLLKTNGKKGRYIRITLNKDDKLRLAEVIVR